MNHKILKLLSSSLFIFVSVSAHANLLSQLNAKVARAKISKDFTPAQPIRKAQIGMRVERIDLIKDANGSFSQKSTEICKIKTTTKVYDFRSDRGELRMNDIEIAKCHTDTGGSSNDILISGAIFIWNPLVIDQTEDIKELNIGLEVQGALASKQNFLSSSSGTKDLNAKSFVMHIQPQVIIDCNGGICAPSIESYFVATVDVED